MQLWSNLHMSAMVQMCTLSHKNLIKGNLKSDVVVHTFIHNTQEAEASRFLSWRSTWSTRLSFRLHENMETELKKNMMAQACELSI